MLRPSPACADPLEGNNPMRHVPGHTLGHWTISIRSIINDPRPTRFGSQGSVMETCASSAGSPWAMRRTLRAAKLFSAKRGAGGCSRRSRRGCALCDVSGGNARPGLRRLEWPSGRAPRFLAAIGAVCPWRVSHLPYGRRCSHGSNTLDVEGNMASCRLIINPDSAVSPY